ncbi:uncharacterized protein PG986_002840 [Apiospora aurea]|uniref:Dynamin-type G domain-containing protein n=1 Tax=Apiospora aurea TaxID=335848 RepID=A0ABR1QPY6_9PEZI
MPDAAIGSTALLASDDSRRIIDLIDSLSSHGVNHYLDLPQIIVCGDQSSGKSSVLEAISRVPFEAQDGLCTPFATELVLRRQEEAEFKVFVTRHGVAEEATLEGESTDLAIEKAIEAAKERLILSDGKAFSRDILRIEVSGPNQPHLTLVDLPGLFQSSTITQSAEDAQTVEELVISYMKKPRIIILAVVSAANEFALQQVTQRAREIDPNGFITKPDKLDRYSNTEKFYVNLSNTKEVPLSLGWHVLRNRGFGETTVASDVRDQLEPKFFAKSPWNKLTDSQLGVESLKSRLSRVLHNHVLKHIPNVLEEIQSSLKECKIALEHLGRERRSQKEQRA